MPVIPGEKPENERFPGAVTSLCIEAMMQDGKALQAGTSHYLGQNFCRRDGDRLHRRGRRRAASRTPPPGASSTRLMGALVMTHADDDGLRVPPRVAPQQVVIVPITRDDPEPVLRGRASELAAELGAQQGSSANRVRVSVDDRERKPAEKRWEWIRKGAPLVVEIGERDIEQGVVTVTAATIPGWSASR